MNELSRLFFVTILILFIMTTTVACSELDQSDSTNVNQSGNDPGISKAEFELLKTNMTYEEAVAIIGGPGEILSESGTPGGTGLDIHIVLYMWEGES